VPSFGEAISDSESVPCDNRHPSDAAMKVLLVSEGAKVLNHAVFRVLETGGVTFRHVVLSELRNEKGSRLARKFGRYFPSGKITQPIADAVAAFRPDLVHIATGRPVALAVMKALEGQPGVPVLFDHGAIGGLNLLNPFDWKTYFNRRVDKLVVPSHAMVNNWMGGKLLRRCISPSRVAVLHHAIELPEGNGVDRAALRARLGIGPKDFAVGTVCAIRPIKNLPFLADVVRRLGPPFVLVVVGATRDEAELRRLREAGGDRLKLVGQIANARDLMPAFDLYATPTQMPGESFGLAIAEAMSRSVPVLSMNVGGTGDIVENEVSGLALPADPMHWKLAIAALATDPDRRTRMGAAGRQRIADRFSPEAIAAECLGLYRRTARLGGM